MLRFCHMIFIYVKRLASSVGNFSKSISPNAFLVRLILGAVFLTVSRISFASGEPDVDLEKMISISGAVIIATVISIDENQYNEESGPQTKYTLFIEEVLGGNVSGDRISYVAPGGIYPNNTERLSISIVPELSLGETYILFLRKGKYVYHPFLNCRNAILKVDRRSTKAVITDRYGHIVNVSANAKDLVHGDKVAKSLVELRKEQLTTQATSNTPLETENEAIELASSEETVKALIKSRIEKSITEKNSAFSNSFSEILTPTPVSTLTEFNQSRDAK